MADSANNGSYPDPANSIKFTSTTTNSHLFSPSVSIDPSATYMMKNFINVQSIGSGELGFYIDEYDANGNWISGQWKGAEKNVFVENYNFTYKATSAAVSTASLQIYSTGNAGITAYVDNVQWFPLTAVTLPTQPTNLVANGTFDNGIANDWRTDSGSFVVSDDKSNGSPLNPINSVKMTSSSKNVHLFSPLVSVSSLTTYNMSTYVKITQLSSGELGFYIDEYDANGNWISGQWKGAKYNVSTGNFNFSYKPTSGNVAKSSMQIYLTGNSGITAYVDNVVWTKP